MNAQKGYQYKFKHNRTGYIHSNYTAEGGGRVNKEKNDIDILDDDNANDKSIGIHEEIFQIIKE